MRAVVVAALIALLSVPIAAQPSQSIALWRLDCGTIDIKDLDSRLSDAHDYPPGPHQVTASCYLIRHGSQWLLWDAGLPASLRGRRVDVGLSVRQLDRTIAEQIAVLGLRPSDIGIMAISHRHDDHTGQASQFAGAKLVIGSADFDASRGKDDPLGPWRVTGAKVELVTTSDLDIFGDGSVVALRMPGHTDAHMSLLVRLASGPVLLSGDLYHTLQARRERIVPPFNSNRADTLASMDRFERLAAHWHARVIIQHEPLDIAKLPAFPKPAL